MRILVAEDDVRFQCMYRSVLPDWGFEPHIVDEGQAAVIEFKKVLESNPFDGVISDLYMGDQFAWNGNMLYDEVDRIAEGTPFVFVTSKPSALGKFYTDRELERIKMYHKDDVRYHAKFREFLDTHLRNH